METSPKTPRRPRKDKYKSTLECSVARQLSAHGIDYKYEPHAIDYVTEHSYTPDFILPNGVYIETKGWFRPEDRSKHLAIKRRHPRLDIRFIFSNAGNKLNKNSKSTLADWCDKHGFLWAQKIIPEAWLHETPSS